MNRMMMGLCLLACAMPAGAEDWSDMQVQRTVDHVLAIHDYQGTMEISGLYGKQKVVSEIRFARPHAFYIKVTAPAALAGTVTAYQDDTLTSWLPNQQYAVVIHHLTPPSAATEAARIGKAWRLNNAHYLYGLGKTSTVAGVPTIALDQRARSSAALIQSATTQVFDQYSFPVAGKVTFRGGEHMSYRFDALKMNDKTVVPAAPALPASAMVASWDLQWPTHAPADLHARLPAARAFPDSLAGVPLTRRLVHPGALPAVAGYYHDQNTFVLVTASRDMHCEMAGPAYGVDVPLGKTLTARLTISALNSTWVFHDRGVVYTVFSNADPEVLYGRLKTWAAGSDAI